MAADDYVKGTMPINAQSTMFDGVMKAGAWGAIITLLMIGYSTFILSLGMPWLVALALTAGAGIIIGLAMGFGGVWVATMVALSGLAILIQLTVFFAGLLIG